MFFTLSRKTPARLGENAAVPSLQRHAHAHVEPIQALSLK